MEVAFSEPFKKALKKKFRNNTDFENHFGCHCSYLLKILFTHNLKPTNCPAGSGISGVSAFHITIALYFILLLANQKWQYSLISVPMKRFTDNILNL